MKETMILTGTEHQRLVVMNRLLVGDREEAPNQRESFRGGPIKAIQASPASVTGASSSTLDSFFRTTPPRIFECWDVGSHPMRVADAGNMRPVTSDISPHMDQRPALSSNTLCWVVPAVGKRVENAG